MKAITTKRTLIHCDTCHHEFTGDPTEWLHKPCPECGAPDIITGDDLAALRGTLALIDVVNEAWGESPDDPDAKTVTIMLRTADHDA